MADSLLSSLICIRNSRNLTAKETSSGKAFNPSSKIFVAMFASVLQWYSI